MPKKLSELEALALAALTRMGPDAYGVTIREEIARGTGRSVSTGSLYKAIHRLEERGLVRFEIGEPTPERGGRAKKHVLLAPAGRRALEASARRFRWVVGGLQADGSTG